MHTVLCYFSFVTKTFCVAFFVRKHKEICRIKGTTCRFSCLENLSATSSSLPFVFCVNLLHPYPSLFLCGLLLSLWCFYLSPGCHRSGNSQGKKKFFKVREKSGNFTLSQGKFTSEKSQGKVKF